MADIQSATAKIRRGKKNKEEEERNHSQKYNGLPYSIAYGDHNKVSDQKTLYYATSNNLCFRRFLWSPYIIGQTIIFLPLLWPPYVIGGP